MGLIDYIIEKLNLRSDEPQPASHQREEGSDEVLIFVVDESYSRIGEYVNWDDYPDEWSETEAASTIFLEHIKAEFDARLKKRTLVPARTCLRSSQPSPQTSSR